MKNTGEKRPLTPGEIKLARSVFGDRLDYSKIKITHRRFGLFAYKNGGRVFMNTLNASGTSYCEDYSKQGPGKQSFFIHEMAHIWQYQTDCPALCKKVVQDVLKHNFNYASSAYKYRLDQKTAFSKYGHEQQASIIQDFFLLSRYGLSSVRQRCQNTDMGAQDRLALYTQLLKNHLPIGREDISAARPTASFKK